MTSPESLHMRYGMSRGWKNVFNRHRDEDDQDDASSVYNWLFTPPPPSEATIQRRRYIDSLVVLLRRTSLVAYMISGAESVVKPSGDIRTPEEAIALLMHQLEDIEETLITRQKTMDARREQECVGNVVIVAEEEKEEEQEQDLPGHLLKEDEKKQNLLEHLLNEDGEDLPEHPLNEKGEEEEESMCTIS